MMKKPFSLLVKPASADCNLHCEYCFYLDRKDLYPEAGRHRMTDEVLERMISSYMATTQPTYSFGWQGGEPTLMGHGFFEKVVAFQKKHGSRGAVVGNGLQTNATLINEELAAHLSRYNFLVGASLDGPANIHNQFRKTEDGRTTHSDVMRGIELLRRHKVEYNILVLVSSANVHRAQEVYRYLVDMGEMYHQYIPCVEFDATGKPLPYSINGEQWGDFLCSIFDEWKDGDTYRVSIRLFDSILTSMVDGRVNVCSMDTNCCQYFVIEHNGDIYPCDFFVQRALRLGNIMKSSWEEMLESPAYREFGARKAKWHDDCRTCPYVRLCAGDCQKQRFYGAENPRQLSFLCEGWQRFFAQSLPYFERLSESVRKQRARASVAQLAPADIPKKMPGRNAPCYCGSGKKYKHCHGR